MINWLKRLKAKWKTKNCKYCYGKGYYSVFRAGGIFGDSFDGRIVLKPKIENNPCPKCNKQ